MKRLISSLLTISLLALGLFAIPAPANAAVSSNGLILHLDAGNSSSYPGTGTTWTDTSGSGFNGTLTNGPTYSSSNGGYIGFDGSNDYVSFGNISTNFSTGFSTTFFANFGASTQGWERVMDFGTGQGNNNILVARNGNTDTFTFELYNGSGSSLGQCSATSTVSNNTWAHYGVTVDGTNCRIYKNGVLVATNSYTALPTIITRTSNYIGRSNWSADGYFDSGIGEISMYNRAISASEVWQNYKAESSFCTSNTTSSGNTRYVQITAGTGCLWNVPTGVTSIDYVIVGAGGGGGGANNGSLGAGGGGGGGQVTTSTSFSVTAGSSLSLTIGTGGAGGTVNSNGGNGGSTTLSNFSTTYTATGGNGGQGAPGTATQADLSGDGGSAGGGNAAGVSNWDGGGGGGGAGSVGTDGTDIGGQGGNGGAGGTGVTSSAASSSSLYFGAGGGGGGTPSNNVAPASQTDGFGALGGSSVGGNGGVVSSTKASGGYATAGTANTGSGGGGGGWNYTYTATQKMGGAGGDGVIWIKYTKTAGSLTSISITSSAGSDSQYTYGETITATVLWSETVTITGTPRIPVQGLTSKYFTYSSGSDSSSTTFIYVVGNGDLDTDGIAINANTLELNGGTIKDTGGLDCTITHSAINASIAYYVDGRLIGTVNSISFSTNPSYRSPVTITVNVSIAGNVLFKAKNAKIANCVKRSTSGTSPNITATCVWRPSTRGATPVTATITPTNGSYSASSLTNTVFVTNRSGSR
jgi:hypothetical protein